MDHCNARLARLTIREKAQVPQSQSMSTQSQNARRRVSAHSASTKDMRLSYDVLVNTMAMILERRRILNLMKTCKTLYYIGMPYLLRDRINLNGTHRQLRSFCDLIHCDVSRRGPLLRSLRISYTPIHPHDPDIPSHEEETLLFQRFIQLLPHCSNLRYLELFHVDKWFALDRKFPLTLQSLPTYEFLLLEGEDEYTIKLSPARRNLKTIAIIVSGRKPVKCDSRSFLHSDSNANSGVEELHVKNLFLTPDSWTSRFPTVKTFSIEQAWTVDVYPLCDSFPSLRNLIYHGDVYHAVASRPEFHRKKNIEKQKVIRWDSLDYFAGTLAYLYILAPQCRIRHISLRISNQDDESIILSWSTILLNTRPSRLTIQFNLENWRASILPMLIPPELNLEVTHVDLTIAFRNSNRITMDHLEVYLLRLASASPLRFLRLTLFDSFDFMRHDKLRSFNPGAPPQQDKNPRPLSAAAVDQLENESLTFATRIARNTHGSLRYIIFDLPTHPDILYWEVEETDGGPFLNPMNEKLGIKICAQEIPEFTTTLRQFSYFDLPSSNSFEQTRSYPYY